MLFDFIRLMQLAQKKKRKIAEDLKNNGLQ